MQDRCGLGGYNTRYEYEKGKFVIISDEEIEHIPIKTSKSIDILRFIDAGEIEPIYYDRSYYLEHVEGGERAYALLRETMKAAGKVALSKIIFKDKEHIAILRVFHDIIMLRQQRIHPRNRTRKAFSRQV